MSMAESASDQGLKWELTDLYSGFDDPAVFADFDQSFEKAQRFHERLKDREVSHLSPSEFITALKEYESILEKGVKPYLYASLLFSEDSQNPAYKSLLQKGKERWNELENTHLIIRLALTR